MKAIGYIRVSTEEQAQEGVSLGAQKAKIAAWCELNDYTLTTVYVDAGISGKSADNRPGLQQALSECKKDCALVVYSLSRLARSTEDTLRISRMLDKAGADLVSLSEKIDTTSAAGKMVFRMLAVLAEFERDQISERTATAMSHKKARSELVGAVPFGKSLAADGKILVDNPAEQAVITEARKLRAAGLTLKAVAEELYKAGMVARNGRQFDTTQIRRLMANG